MQGSKQEPAGGREGGKERREKERERESGGEGRVREVVVVTKATCRAGEADWAGHGKKSLSLDTGLVLAYARRSKLCLRRARDPGPQVDH